MGKQEQKMNLTNQNTQKTLIPNPNSTQQQQPCSSSSNCSVPPLSDVDSITKQLKGHGFSDKEIGIILNLSPSSSSSNVPFSLDSPIHEPFLKRGIEDDDDTDSFYMDPLPHESYTSSKRLKLYNFLDPKGKKPLIDDDDNNSNTIVISDSDDEDDQRKELTENQISLDLDINETETNDSDGADDEIQTNVSIRRNRYRKYNKDAAKRYASQIHTVSENEDDHHAAAHEIDDNLEHEVDADDGSPTPFSEAIKAIQERIAKSKKKGVVKESFIWVPKRNGEDLVKGRFRVPSLQEMSLKILANHADGMVSLDGVSDELKQRLSALVCDSRKMNCRFLELLLSGFPTHIRLKDCSWLTEEEFTKCFGMLDTSILEVLQLDQCGRVITEYTLLSTLAKSPSCLSRLISLSLTGACRLTDKGLQLLVSSATALRSINLSQCSLLTYASLNILADSFGSILKELYLDDCILIDAALILSALKQLKQLEVLSLAGVPTVCDKFIKSYIIACGQNIKELVLKDCINLTDASMKVIATHCPGLQALDLMNLWKLTDLTIGYLTNSCQALRILNLCRNPFSDEAIAAFLEMTGKSLEELSLNNIKKVGQQTTLSLANNAKNLHTLDLSWCRNLTDNEFGLIVDSCLSLRSLKLFGCSQVTNVFLNGHSNLEIQIIGLKLCPLLQHIKEPNPNQGALRYS